MGQRPGVGADPCHLLGYRPLVQTTVTAVLVLWSGFQYVNRSITVQNPRFKREEAFAYLGALGAHFLLCRHDKKTPIRKEWQRPYNAAGLYVVHLHLEEGGRIGLIPHSVKILGRHRMWILDVDAGDPAELIERHPPLAVVPTERPGGLHLIFASDTAWRPGNWWAHQCFGQIRSEGAYVIVWDVERLAAAVQHFDGMAGIPPDCLVTGPAARNAAVAAGLVKPGKKGRPVVQQEEVRQEQGRQNSVGGRGPRPDSSVNAAVFDLLRLYAYGRVGVYRDGIAEGGLSGFLDEVMRESEGINVGFEQPLSMADLTAMAHDVGTWTWNKYGGWGSRYASTESELQRRRIAKRWLGSGSDASLAFWDDHRNPAIVKDAAAGMSQRALAHKYKLSRWRIREILGALGRPG